MLAAMLPAIARRVVRLYPPAWRRRYEGELLALIEAETVTLVQIGEDELIRRLTHALPLSADVVAGAGDDCAVVRPVRGRNLQLLKTDCIIEGVHFLRDTEPERVGWKAMARVASDIAAMGGTPEEFGTLIKAETAKWRPVVESLGLMSK